MERVTGIEPAWPAWKAGALPLSYTRKVLAGESVLLDTFFLPFILPAEAEGVLQGIKVSGLVRRCELDPLDFLLTPRGVA